MAVAERAPDILLKTAIPLSSTSDMPLAEVPQPPLSASNNAADLGVRAHREISAEELAAAAAARKGQGPNTEVTTTDPKVEVKTDSETTNEKPLPEITDPDVDSDILPENVPGYAAREIAKIRKAAREYKGKVLAAARAHVGDSAWDAAMAATRDKAVEDARADLARVTKEANDNKTAREAAEAEAAELRAKLPAPPEPEIDAKPTRDAFDDPDVYDAALTDWGIREGERKAAAKIAAETAETETAARKKADDDATAAREADLIRINTEWHSQREAAIEKYPDYVEVAEADFPVSGPMAAAIVETENGTDVLYHLGQNPDIARKIAEITNPFKQGMEIARLSERLANPPQRRARPQPPIEPLDDHAAQPDSSSVEIDMATYYAKRNADLNGKRRPFFPASELH